MIKSVVRHHSTVRWFYATDVPLSKPLDPKYKCSKPPKKFLPFSKRDSTQIEETWSQKRSLANKPVKRSECLVNVHEDGLFECDVGYLDLKPVYWKGPNYEIRRGLWLLNNEPLPYYLSNEIENKYQHYKKLIEQNEDIPNIKLKSEVQYFKEANGDSRIWPYTEWDDLLNNPKTLHFKDAENAMLLNQNQLISKIVADNFQSSNQYLGVYSITRGYKEDKKQAENESVDPESSVSFSNDNFSFSGLQERIFKSDSSDIADKKYQKIMEDDFSNDNMNLSNDPDRQVDHLVLAVHGIGQSLSSKYSGINFAHDCNYLRHLFKGEFIKNPNEFTKEKDNKENCKIQILPVIWRNDVDFGWDTVYEDYEHDGKTRRLPKLSELNLEGVGPVRSLVADVVLDVLLYYEPRFKTKILEIVTKKFNETYDLYLKNNPNFKGRVSLLGHSLGSAIVLDIANLQPDKIPKEGDLNIRKHLKFPINDMFCLGSPNGVFQLIRGANIRPRDTNMVELQNKPIIKPKVKNLYNIFYGSDVIAYRMEPLVYSSLGQFEPREIESHTKVDVIKSKIKEVDLSSLIMERFGWKIDLNLPSVSSNKKEIEIDLPIEVKKDLIELNKNGRIDYVLPRGLFDIDMINAIASHIQYFNDSDVANFIMKELWNDVNLKEKEDIVIMGSKPDSVKEKKKAD